MSVVELGILRGIEWDAADPAHAGRHRHADLFGVPGDGPHHDVDPRGARRGGRRARQDRDPARAGLDHGLDHGGRTAQARRVRHRAAARRPARGRVLAIDVSGISPLRRGGRDSVSALRLDDRRNCCRSSDRRRARRTTAASRASSRSTTSSRTRTCLELGQVLLTGRSEQIPSPGGRERRARDARCRRDHVRRSRGAGRVVPIRGRPAPHAARGHRRGGRAPVVFDLLRREGRDAAHRGQAQSRRRVLGVGERHPQGRRHARGDAADGAFQRAAGAVQSAALRRLRGGQRHHAAPVHRQDDARNRAAVAVHALLRQPRVGHRDVQGGARGAEGHEPRAPQPRPRALARGAGHRAPARSHRPRQGRRADRPLARPRLTSTRCSSADPTA